MAACAIAALAADQPVAHFADEMLSSVQRILHLEYGTVCFNFVLLDMPFVLVMIG